MASRLDRDDVQLPIVEEQASRVVENPKAELPARQRNKLNRTRTRQDYGSECVRFFDALVRITNIFVAKGHPNHAIIALVIIAITILIFSALVYLSPFVAAVPAAGATTVTALNKWWNK